MEKPRIKFTVTLCDLKVPDVQEIRGREIRDIGKILLTIEIKPDGYAENPLSENKV